MSSSQRLYYEGIRRKESLNQKRELIKREKLHNETKEATFKPQFVSKPYNKVKYGSYRTQSIEYQKPKNEMDDCTFSPKVNPRSRALDQKITRQSRFLSLYDDAQLRTQHLLEKSAKM